MGVNVVGFLVFSCEIGAREYMPRVVLGLRLAAKGHWTIVGHKFAVANLLPQLPNVPKGLFVHKDANSDAMKYFQHAKKFGLNTAGMDDEMLNIAHCQDGKIIGNPVNAGVCDYVIASTKITKENFRLNGFDAVLLGSLRLGLCELIRASRGFSISTWGERSAFKQRAIINSPCCLIFSGYPLLTHLEMRSRLFERPVAGELEKLKEYLDVEFGVYQDIIKILSTFANNLDLTVRAHPGENPAGWKMLCDKSGFSTSIDPGESSFITELIDKDFMIGFNCTTHLECFAMGKRSVMLGRGSAVEETLTDKYFPKFSVEQFLGASGVATSMVASKTTRRLET